MESVLASGQGQAQEAGEGDWPWIRTAQVMSHGRYGMVGVDCRASSERGPAVMVNAGESVWAAGDGVGRMTGEEATPDQPVSILGTAEQRMWD